MIILFTSSIGLMISGYKKKQIDYIEKLIYISERIILLLESTSPDTEEIMLILQKDSHLEGFEFNTSNSPLADKENRKIDELFEFVGRYDCESQIKVLDEFSGYFKILKQEYQQHYTEHKKLYIMFGIFTGLFVSILLI